MKLNVWHDHVLGWVVSQEGHTDEADPLPDYLTQDAPEEWVLRLVRESFCIQPEDVLVFFEPGNEPPG